MPEGTHRIVLREPISQRQGPSGAPEIAEWRDHVAWAQRVDRGGSRVIRDEALNLEWDSEFTFRRHKRIEGLNQTWVIRDARGLEYNIARIGLVGGTLTDQLRINKFRVQATSPEVRTDQLPTLVDQTAFSSGFDFGFE
ncbi:MAG: head-tail adaptor protein [Bryobacterales bacterium]|nr:head-tail adaptor protein [Bryobacterales bacterium]